jgi:regulator of protease activity HflC (stomatin/prohibitin superfamily)
LTMTINIDCRFQVNPATVGWLHKHVGPEYLETLVVPVIGSYARLVFAQNSADDIYTVRRAAVQQEIQQALIRDFAQQAQKPADGTNAPILLHDILIHGMRFPPTVQAAINRKMEQYQLREEYAYRIQRERLESERKEIEARGIAQFQSIVGAGISDSYLRWKGIDATVALAESPNTKIVVIGSEKGGMPLILGGMDAPSTRPPDQRIAKTGDASSAADLPGDRPFAAPLADHPDKVESPHEPAPGGFLAGVSGLVRRLGTLTTPAPLIRRRDAQSP